MSNFSVKQQINLVPKLSLLPRGLREVWERGRDKSLLMTSQLTVESRSDRDENVCGLG